MAQRIIDLDVLIPDDLAVRINNELYPLPGDIGVPQYLSISRTFDSLVQATGEEAAVLLEDLYEQVLELFRERQPDLEALPIGPRRLSQLVVDLYTSAAAGDGGGSDRPTRPKAGTRSTSRKKTTRSRSSK